MTAKKFKARHGIDLNGETLDNAYDIELNSNHPAIASIEAKQGKTLSLAEMALSMYGVALINMDGANDVVLTEDEQKLKAIVVFSGVGSGDHPTLIFNEFSPLPVTQVFNITTEYIFVGMLDSDGVLTSPKWRVDSGGSICLIRVPGGGQIFRMNPVDPTATRQVIIDASDRISGSPQTIQLTTEESESQVITINSGSPTPPAGLITVLQELPYLNTTPGPSFQLFKNNTASDIQYKRDGFTGVTIHAGQSGIVYYNKDTDVTDMVLAASIYADDLIYNNANTNLAATTVKAAIDEMAGAYIKRYEAQITTTNDTATAALTIPIAAGKAFSFQVYLVGTKTASTNSPEAIGDMQYARIHGGIKNVNGTVSIVGSNDEHRHRDDAGWEWPTVTASGSPDSLVVTVQGDAGDTILWTVNVILTGNW